MKKKKTEKLLKLVDESRQEGQKNLENFLLGEPQNNEAFLRLTNFVHKKLRKETKK